MLLRAGRMAVVAVALSLGAATQAEAHMKITSPDIADGGTIKMEQVFAGCGGANVSPALEWSGAPAATKSFALTIYDPDAPTGSGWWHWVMYDIPASAAGLAKGAGDPKSPARPAGSVEARNDYGSIGYGGPCPPKGDKPHRYQITVFALDVAKLPVGDNPSPASVGFVLREHTLAKATLVGLYGH